MGVLRARVGGTWVDIAGGTAGSDEVFVGPSDPLPSNSAMELWYDTDAVPTDSAGGGAAPVIPITANYTLQITDASSLLLISVPSAMTLTVPLNAGVGFAVGTRVDIVQAGAGSVTVAGAQNVTINATPGALTLRSQWAGGSLIKTATDTWLLVGNLVGR